VGCGLVESNNPRSRTDSKARYAQKIDFEGILGATAHLAQGVGAGFLICCSGHPSEHILSLEPFPYQNPNFANFCRYPDEPFNRSPNRIFASKKRGSGIFSMAYKKIQNFRRFSMC